MPSIRTLKASDSIEAKALLLIQNHKVQIIGMDENELIAEVQSDLDGEKYKIPYLIRIVKHPPYGKLLHTCSCTRFSYLPKRLQFFWGTHATLLTPECSHIYAVKLLSDYQLWWREQIQTIPENLRSFVRNTHHNAMPLDLTRLDPENRRRKINFVSFLDAQNQEKQAEQELQERENTQNDDARIKRIKQLQEQEYWEED